MEEAANNPYIPAIFEANNIIINGYARGMEIKTVCTGMITAYVIKRT